MSNQIEKRFLKIQENILDDLLTLESPKNRKPMNNTMYTFLNMF